MYGHRFGRDTGSQFVQGSCFILPTLSLCFIVLCVPFFSQPINNADFVVPVEIEDATHQVYVLKRPHVDEFLQKMGQLYECVLFTASLAKVCHGKGYQLWITLFSKCLVRRPGR